MGIVVSSGISAFLTYKNNENLNNNKLQKEIVTVKNAIIAEITEHSWYVRSLANKIKNDSNLEDISQIINFQNSSNFNFNFSQPSNQKNLYWVDSSNNLIIKNRVGIIQYPQRISSDFEVGESKKNPWKLIISKNLPYIKNGNNLIPTSFGVTGKDGKYIGSIISFIDANLIQNLIRGANASSKSNFVIVNPANQKFILQSDSKHLIENQNFFVGKIDKILNREDTGVINQDIIDGDFRYSHYQNLDEYPLVIISGYNYLHYQENLIKSLIKSILPSIGIGLLLLGILLLFYRRTIKPIRDLCEIARKIGHNDCADSKFPRNINCPEIYDLTKALLKIKHQRISIDKSHLELQTAKNKLEEAFEVAGRSDVAQIEIIKQIRSEITKNTAQIFQFLYIIKHNIENHGSFVNSEMNLRLLNNIEQEVGNIINFATDELNKELVDIKYLIDRVILSQEKEIKTKDIVFQIDYENNLPKKVYVDQVRLTQILSSVINKTIKILPSDSKVNICIKTITKNKHKHVAIKIEDNGIGIGIKEYLESAKKRGGYEESAVSGIDISIRTIEELVKLHGGEIFYNNKIQQGSTTTITIPYPKTQKISKPRETAANNIVYLPLRNK